jgi:hypothetical protein
VAIKVLPEELSRDKERLDWFEREAKLLAQLNRSNVATDWTLLRHLYSSSFATATSATSTRRGSVSGEHSLFRLRP